ncbi:MAG: tRNA (adenosine(37)-N6)-threonylcarbamoyltransferase complex dimerization subunit type 1 TsaB [Anaerovoracaceae bacterium]|jgi:tRNA threonylcarbamoyladenosine biosynthesis protein TsaB
MHILAIETTGPYCSVALINENGEIKENTSDQLLSHLQSLTVMIASMLSSQDMTLADVDAIAVSEGPGSFTGIRIGVSTARGISQVLGTKLVPVPTLRAFASYEYALMPEEKSGTLVCHVIDARRSQVYAAGCIGDEEAVPGGAYMLDEFLGMLGDYQDIRFVGDGVKKYGAEIREWAEKNGKNIETEEAVQHAAGVARLGLKLYDAGVYCGYEELKPNYMRKAEAERKLEAKKAAEAANG